jgi:8-oxo-dGTP diphosphatase
VGAGAMDNEETHKFCVCCGGPLVSRTVKVGDPDRLACERCGFVFYLDPKVAVGTIIRMPDDRIVLARRAISPGYGLWVFPGGYVDRGEKLEDAAIREALEECGLTVELEGLVNVYSYRGQTPVIVVYAARAVAGMPHASDEESLEVGTFTADTIPWDRLAFGSTAQALREYLGRRSQRPWA